jgi:fibronectin type 3 domain-containing protein
VKLAAALFALAWIALMAGCGYPGDPKPPALEIPSRVTDLRAAEYGGNILVEFTLPALTTEGLALTKVKAVELRVSTGATSGSVNLKASTPGPIHDQIAANEWVGKDVVLTVRATGPKGKTSEWSNAVPLSVGVPLGVPANLVAENVADGVRLRWQGNGPRYRVFRSLSDQTPDRLAESDQPEYVDRTTNYGSMYKYFVQAITADDLRQSEISVVVAITPRDDFPPAVPAGLSAVAGVSAIELAWERNTEDDFRGYNVYRSTEGAAFEKVAALIDAPAYSDRQVEAGKRYRYAVSSVDQAGNESRRGEAVEVTAQ